MAWAVKPGNRFSFQTASRKSQGTDYAAKAKNIITNSTKGYRTKIGKINFEFHLTAKII